MPAKKPTNKSVGDYDPLAFPGNKAPDQPAPKAALPMSITPRFTSKIGGEIVFDSPVAELIKFGECMLARLENDAMFLTTDGTTWRRFIFEIIPVNQESA